jgi:hypothetical protein
MEQNKALENPGKAYGVAGFAIGICAFLTGIELGWICPSYEYAGNGLGIAIAIAWTLVSLGGFFLSIFGLLKSKMAGFVSGNAIAGIVFGVLAIIVSTYIIYSAYEMRQNYLNEMQGIQAI